MRTIDCDLARERFSLQLDGELSSYEMVLLERHLSWCSACATFVSETRRVTELLRSAPLEEAPRFVLPRRRRPRRVGVSAAVASTAAAAVAAISTLSFTKPSNPQVALSFVPATRVAVQRAGSGPLGLKHPSAVKLTARRPVLGLQNSSRHGLFG